MHTIRSRLTLWYAVALGATVFAFALFVYQVQRSENVVDLDARAAIESSLIAGILTVYPPGSLVLTDGAGRRSLAPRVARHLDSVPDYVIVLGTGRETLYLSAGVKALPYEDQVRLIDRASQPTDTISRNSIDIGPPVG